MSVDTNLGAVWNHQVVDFFFFPGGLEVENGRCSLLSHNATPVILIIFILRISLQGVLYFFFFFS